MAKRDPSAPTWLERLRGKRTRNITLPNESGLVDERLIGTARGTVGKAREILRNVPQPGSTRSMRGKR